MKRFLALFTLAGLPLFAQEEGGRQGNFTQTLIMIGVALVFFYFILWRPEQKRRKAMQHQRESLKAGDRVTAMGLIGTVDSILEKTVVLKMIDGAKVEVLKAAITDVQPAGATDDKRVDINPTSSK